MSNFRFVIQAKPSKTFPVGAVFIIEKTAVLPNTLLYTNGSYVSKDLFPELYSVIGDNYCPKQITRNLPLTAFQKLKRFFGFRYSQKTVVEDNPEYVEGLFALPYLSLSSDA